MKGKALFAVGVAVGYVWGSKSWPEVYRRLRGGTEKVLNNPDVQQNVHQATEAVQESVPDILDNLYDAGKKLLEKVETLFPGISAPKSGQDSSSKPTVTTVPTVTSDVISDPALDDSTGADWTDEGGAAPEGPATNTRPRS
ncbi:MULTISPECIES: hypothetical protein [unclassified Arthrobacter]|uniref:hypothetical protein n=1 Tax=unclassified Arthrobacter TaxID=235627 RepID=UPI002550E605|nr:hypothetical protein [Arthrobacter sp. fls2-241-R2A-172]